MNANHDKLIQVKTIKFLVIKFITMSINQRKIIHRNRSNNDNLFKNNEND